MRQFDEEIDRVLIVEDDLDFVRLLRRMLQESPVRRYQVSSVRSGRQALARMRQRAPDLILLDLGLPDMDGSELVELVRADKAWAHIPIIVVSAQEEIDRRQTLQGMATLAKADGFVPVEIVEWVQQAIRTAVKSLPTAAAPREAPAWKQVSPEKL
jgi:two-component system KDP operon response regulator KdpE